MLNYLIGSVLFIFVSSFNAFANSKSKNNIKLTSAQSKEQNSDQLKKLFSDGHAILETSHNLNMPCYEVFIKAVYPENPVTYRKNYSDIKNFAMAACQTSNPDIIWDIAKVESNFNFMIVNIAGKKILKDEDQINKYLNNDIKNPNFDLGPMQINWKYHAEKSGYPASYFFDGKFSVYYVVHNILGKLLSTCDKSWINCYHSRKSKEGMKYKNMIYIADIKLRKNLRSSPLLTKYKK